MLFSWVVDKKNHIKIWDISWNKKKHSTTCNLFRHFLHLPNVSLFFIYISRICATHCLCQWIFWKISKNLFFCCCCFHGKTALNINTYTATLTDYSIDSQHFLYNKTLNVMQWIFSSQFSFVIGVTWDKQQQREQFIVNGALKCVNQKFLCAPTVNDRNFS